MYYVLKITQDKQKNVLTVKILSTTAMIGTCRVTNYPNRKLP